MFPDKIRIIRITAEIAGIRRTAGVCKQVSRERVRIAN